MSATLVAISLFTIAVTFWLSARVGRRLADGAGGDGAGRTPIPLDAAFRVEPGELLALVGHSGSGKTTLLRTIAGLWRPETARVRWTARLARHRRGVDLAPHRRRVGIVFQNYALFPHMTAAQNVMAAMDRPDRAEAERILDLVNLHGLAERKPAQLSGGQQQRVAVARALARRPQALLLDEPFSAVDRATREKLHGEIIALRAHLAMPVVLVTHDVNEAQLLADRHGGDRGGPGRARGHHGRGHGRPRGLARHGHSRGGGDAAGADRRASARRAHRLETAAGPLFLPTVEGAPGTECACGSWRMR
jgi:molybdate transport system ATP-binding protein